MSDSPEDRIATPKDYGVVAPCPQIAVGVNSREEIVISTSEIADDYERVEHHEVYIPLSKLREVIGMLEAAADDHGV